MNTVTCNMCGNSFRNDDDLKLILERGEYFRGCPECNTDKYLMDIDSDEDIKKHHHVIKFLRLLRGSTIEELYGNTFKGDEDPEDCASVIIKEVFLTGNCGQLVRILKHIYPETKLVRLDAFINPEDGIKSRMTHYVADINGKIYDIEGEFMNSNLKNYEYKYCDDSEFETEITENYSFANRGPIG